MINIIEWLRGRGRNTEYTELECPFRIGISENEFVRYKTVSLFIKILQRCYTQSIGLENEKIKNSLFNSYNQEQQVNGLFNIVADGMANKKNLVIVYDKVGVVRLATPEEEKAIKEDYKKTAQSKKGIIVNFEKYYLSDLVKLYMSLLFNVLKTANTQTSMSRAVMLKISDLRKTISLNTSSGAIEQAKDIIDNLQNGRSILIDAGDNLEQTSLDLSSVEKALEFVYTQLAGELGVSYSFVSGILTSGMAVTGEADTQAEERGIETFFITIFKPICESLYNVELRFKTDNWRELKAIFELTPFIETAEFLTDNQKKALYNDLMTRMDIKLNDE